MWLKASTDLMRNIRVRQAQLSANNQSSGDSKVASGENQPIKRSGVSDKGDENDKGDNGVGKVRERRRIRKKGPLDKMLNNRHLLATD